MRHAHAGEPATLSIRGVPKFTYGHAVRTSRPKSMKINCLTFYSSKYENCKPERARKDSHCHAQREHGCFE